MSSSTLSGIEMSKWHRLPVVSLIFFFLSGIKNTVKHGYQMLPGLVSIWVFVEPVRQHLPLFLGALGVIFLVAVVMQFLRFTYQVSESRVSVRKGVFNRSELNLEFERIQQADIQLPWYLRPFNLRVVRLEGAGAKGNEVELVGLTVEQAKSLQKLVSVTDSELKTEDSEAVASHQPDFQLALQNSDVWRIGLMQNPFIVIGLILAFLTSNNAMRAWVEVRVESFFGQFPDRTTIILIIIAITLVALALVILGSIIFAVNKYHRYKLARSGQRYRYEAGFSSTLNRGFSARKLQGVTIRQGWMARALGRVQIELAQAGGVGQKKERFVIPSLVESNRNLVETDLRVPSVQSWNRLHPLATLSLFLCISFAALLVWPWWSSIAIFAGLYLLRVGFWLRRGWYLDEYWFATKRGLIGTTVRFMPIAKMQSVEWRQGPLQKLFKVGTLVVKSAALNYTLQDVPVDDAKMLSERFILQTRTCEQRWM